MSDTERFISRLSELALECVETARRKNQDYASSADPFKNFRAAEQLGISTETGFLVRMGDKLARVGNLLQRDAAVKDESISDTLKDLSNYALILAIWLEFKTDKPTTELCPRGCGAPYQEPIPEGSHYVTVCCHQVVMGCCGD